MNGLPIAADLAITIERRVPLFIASLGLNSDLIVAVQSYGGLIFHDVTNLPFAAKAAETGVDELIVVSYGAGGHAGQISPFAATQEICGMFDGTLLLAGTISTGRQIAAARLMGAHMADMGTRFMATAESLTVAEHRRMLLEAKAGDIVYTPAISGFSGNFLRAILAAAERDPNDLTPPEKLDFGTGDAKAWRDLWAARQGVGAIDHAPPVVELIVRLWEDNCSGAASLSFDRAV